MVSPSDKQMLRDANGDLIPQYWDITAGEFKPLTGQDGAQDTRLTGSKVEELINSTARPDLLKGDTFYILDNSDLVKEYSQLLIVVRTRDHTDGLEFQSVLGTGTTEVIGESKTFDNEFRFSHVFQVVDEKMSIKMINHGSDTQRRFLRVVGIK